MTSLVRTVAFVVVAALTWTACKQGEGDRCETDDDCSSGLVCAASRNVCQPVNSGGQDASIPGPDASDGVPDATLPVDAALPDATVDANLPDAAVDSAL